MRDNNLQQWMPKTGVVVTLVENVTPRAVLYKEDLVVFMRELVPEETYALVVFHIPTRSEVELFKASFWPTAGTFHTSISISPNGRWLAYVTGETRDSAILTVREMITEGQNLVVSEPVLTVTPREGWNWPHDQMMWATENEISWSDESGIWVADLSSSLIEPVVAIAPSTNTFLFGSPNPANKDEEHSPILTKFIPYLWSPDGRYL